MEALPNPPTNSKAPLQLLLFVDKRPGSSEKIRQIRACLRTLGEQDPFDLQVIDVGDQPHLAEHFKLVATPALIKYFPEPHHILAGSDIVAQIDRCWQRWQQSAKAYADQLRHQPQPSPEAIRRQTSDSIAHLTEITKLSDEIFQLQQQKAELEQQLQFKDRLIAMLAHDLRNPLTAVSIALETLELGFNDTDDAGMDAEVAKEREARRDRMPPNTIAQLLRHARTQAQAIDRMITDILQAARGNTGKLQITPKPIQLRHLFLTVLSDLESQFQAKQQVIKTDIPQDLPQVYADTERIRQVLTNLLDNASKYTPKQGSIQLTVLHRTTQKVQVSICDTGPGIPEENREHIFEDRFRLKRDAGKDGYGIGLALCQRIVRAHYGQIWVDSVPKQGSCFHFTLPVHRA